MGVEDSRRPPLPAPTDLTTSNDESVIATDLATDISHRTDATSRTIPEDGRPITIATRKKGDKLTKHSHNSQTSLLIEYFEGGHAPGPGDGTRRPSVRVKVTPSTARKVRDQNSQSDHIQITETKGKSRTPSYTQRISLTPNSKGERIATAEAATYNRRRSGSGEISTYESATEESNLSGRPPVDIEVMHKDDRSAGSHSPMSPRNSRFGGINESEISSMPAESVIYTNDGKRTRSRSMARTTVDESLKAPSRRRSRSLSKERLISAKVVEKLARDKEEKHRKKSRSRSVSKEHIDSGLKTERRRRSSKTHRDDISDLTSDANSSLFTTSTRPERSRRDEKSDAYSLRSGTSKSSSINNPRLLETVEDAIRRLILPELTALKNEQKTSKNRDRFDRGSSITSGSTGVSREETRRVSKTSSMPDVAGGPSVVLHPAAEDGDTSQVLSTTEIDRKHRRRRRSDKELTETEREERAHRKKSKEHRLREAALAGGAGILTAAALHHHDSKGELDERHREERAEKKERRKKRSERSSRSASVSDSHDSLRHRESRESHRMPLLNSDYNEPSELTRASILSERTELTERPETASSQDRTVRADGSSNKSTPKQKQVTLQRSFGTQHSNQSRGNLSLENVSERSYRSEGKEHHGGHAAEAAAAGALAGAGLGALAGHQHDRGIEEEHNDYDNLSPSHEYGRRLSPIPQSVVSERGEIEEHQEFQDARDAPQHKSSKNTLSSLGHVSHRKDSNKSMNSTGSKAHRVLGLEKGDLNTTTHTQDKYDSQGRPLSDDRFWYPDGSEVTDGGRTNLTREFDDGSFRDSTVDVKHMTNYTDDSMDPSNFDNLGDSLAGGKEVRGLAGAANASMRSTPVAVRSAVASLHQPSLADARSTRSYGAGSERDYGDERSFNESHHTHGHYGDESGFYDGDERFSPDSKNFHQTTTREISVPDGDSLYDKDGMFKDDVELEKSVHSPYSQHSLHADQRASDVRAANKSHSMRSVSSEPIQLGASGLPDFNNPEPEFGFGEDEDDLDTNPSIIQGPSTRAHRDGEPWPYETPPQQHEDDHDHKALEAGILSGLAGAGIGAALANHSNHTGSQDGYAGERGVGTDYSSEYPYGRAEDFQQTHARDMGPLAGRRSFQTQSSANPTPLPKDEGYISAREPHGMSPGPVTPEPRLNKDMGYLDDGIPGIDGVMEGDDPFYSSTHKRNGHGSGNSHGMPSPLYDSATGRGMDRIASKDIVALMDHLTVRDAQRNARDTEILITLVRSAAEMRNSFEDMKKFLAEQEANIVAGVDRNTERSVQKVIQGPRPQPLGTPRTPRWASEKDLDEDEPAKRRNVFRRALRGLSSKNTNDLQKIEEM
jgi:hypothetical protein